MRIVSGEFKGRAIAAPAGRDTRPTSDRARESLFNVLLHAPWSPGIKDRRVLDLFAGSGALGLEAMSRGLGEKSWCTGNHLTLADIAVGCALGYLDFRFAHIDWRAAHPNLKKLHDKLVARPSFVDTAPPQPV